MKKAAHEFPYKMQICVFIKINVFYEEPQCHCFSYVSSGKELKKKLIKFLISYF